MWIFKVSMVSQFYQFYPTFPMKIKFWLKGRFDCNSSKSVREIVLEEIVPLVLDLSSTSYWSGLHGLCLHLTYELIAKVLAGLGGSVGCASNWRPEGRGFDPHRGRQHSLVEIDHEIFSTVILSLLLIQEGQLSVSGEKMCTILVNCLED